jgi:AcrR family transcriptional regulator
MVGVAPVLGGAARQKSEARREQILCAAASCMQQAGFHGTSMAQIAEAADLSVGQIYRYFENKEAVIAAIVAQNLSESRERFAKLRAVTDGLEDAVIAECIESIECLSDPKYVSLHIEVMAEAARNPRVAEIVREADAQERKLMHELMARMRKAHWKDSDVAERGEAIFTLLSGIIVRVINNPDFDRKALGRSIETIIGRLLN